MRQKYRLSSYVNLISNLYTQYLNIFLNKQINQNILTIMRSCYLLLLTKLKTQMILKIIKRLAIAQWTLKYNTRQLFSQAPNNVAVQHSMKLSPTAYNTALIFKKLKSAISLDEAVTLLEENSEEINFHGRTIIFEHFNQFFIDPRGSDSKNVVKMNELLGRIQKISLYESTLKLSILQKSRTFFIKNNSQQKFERLSALYVQEIIKNMQAQISTFIDCLNIFTIFRLQYYPKLNLKALETLDRMLKQDTNQQNTQICSQGYEKFWGIFFNQISYLKWMDMRKFPSFLDFMINKFSIKNLHRKDLELACKVFIAFSQNRFHLVHKKRIPKCIKQSIHTFEKNFLKLSDDQILRLIDSTSYLPAQLIIPFKKKLINRMLGKQNPIGSIHSRFFPVLGLNLEEINLIFDKYETIDWLWNNLIYFSSERLQRKLIRGRVKEHFRKLILQNSKVGSQKKDLFDMSQTVSRLAMLALRFLRDNDYQIVNLIENLITKQLKNKGVKQVVENLSNDNFFTLFVLYQKKPQILKELVEEFKAVTMKRKKNKFFANLRFTKKYLPAIQLFIDSEISVIKNYIRQFYKDLISTFGNSETPQSEEQFIYLIQLMHCKNDSFYAEEKKALLKKIKGDVCYTLCQYYILYERKSYKAFKQILALLIQNSNSVLKVIQFICSLPLHSIQNHKGRVEQTLNDFLTQSKQNLNFGIQYLNEVHTFLDICLEYQYMHQFSFRLYEQNLIQLEKDFEERQWRLVGNGRLVFEFLMKFQQLIPPKDIGKWLVILQRVKRLSQKITDNQKSEFSPFYQTKYLQFLIIYKDYLNLQPGYEIEILFNLQRVLENAYSLLSFEQILFILLKLYSLNIEEAQMSNIVQFSTVIRKSIKEGTFTIYKCKDLVISAIYHIEVLNKTSQIDRFKQVISPLVLQTIRSNKSNSDIHLMKPFLKYFLLTKQIYQIEDTMKNILTGYYTTPSTISFIIKNFPVMCITEQLFKVIVNKIDKMISVLDNNSIEFLFFLQKIWFKVPEQYQSVYIKLWAHCQQYLSGKIKALNGTGKSGKEAEYILGLYPLYLFCCIKTGKLENNKVFEYLSGHILSNKAQFLKKIKSNELLSSINSCIVMYIQKLQNQKLKRNQKQAIFKKAAKAFSITPKFHHSLLLEQHLNQNKIQYIKKCPKDGILLPYFVPSKNQVVLVANTTDENSIYRKERRNQQELELQKLGQLQMGLTNQEKLAKISLNGYFRFQLEIYRFLLRDTNIVVWHNSVGEIMFD